MDTTSLIKEHAVNQSVKPLVKFSVATLLLSSCVFNAFAQSPAGSAEKGKAAFIQHGCWQCHGFVGQGGLAGAKLAPDPKPIEYIQAFVRHTVGPMPKYSEKILPNQDLVDIHAYLKSIPKGPDYKTIPLLN
jgi:ubiquinol-cytochrome c reductase cytochrome c subunit